MKRVALVCCLAIGGLILSADLNAARAQHGHRKCPSDYRSGYEAYRPTVVVRPGISYTRSSLYGPPVLPYRAYRLPPPPPPIRPRPYHPSLDPYAYRYRPIAPPVRPIGPGISLRIGF